MITEYRCSCCRQKFQGRKNCLLHEQACLKAEAAAEWLEKFPKELTADNITDVTLMADNMADLLRDLASYFQTTRVGRETFFLGGTGDRDKDKTKSTTENDNGKDDNDC